MLLNLLSTPLRKVPRSDVFKRFPSCTPPKSDAFMLVEGISCEIFETCCVDDILFRTTRAARATECRPLTTLTSTERLNGEHAEDDEDGPGNKINGITK